jgi:hypothetical protein
MEGLISLERRGDYIKHLVLHGIMQNGVVLRSQQKEDMYQVNILYVIALVIME